MDRHIIKKVAGFVAASCVAPTVTLWIVFGIYHSSAPEFSIPDDWWRFVGMSMFLAAFLAAVAIAFGFIGSAILLGVAFGVLAILMRNRGKVGTRHLMLAGSIAGGLHVGLAYLGMRRGLLGYEGLLGTWLLQREFSHGFAMVLAPPIAGALAGLVYSRISLVTLPRMSPQ